MKHKTVFKFLLVAGIAGLICGAIFGFIFAFLCLGVIHNFEASIFFSVIIFPFFLWSIFKNLKRKQWFVIVRRFIQIVLVAAFVTAMFGLVQGTIPFSRFDWYMIYFCIAALSLLTTFLIVLAEYYNDGKIYNEIKHLIRGMQMSGLLPESEEEKEKK